MTQFRHSVLGFCAVLALACAGCGEEPPSLDTTPSQQPSSPGTPPSSGTEPVTHTGVVVEGVEPNCLILDTGDERYLLLDGDQEQLAPQSKVTVTGVVESGAPTTCMEGTPLRVRKVTQAASR